MENLNTSNRRFRKIGPYLLMKPIGKGAYSTVYEAKKQNQAQLYAVKQIALLNVSQKQQERLHSEIQVLQLIKHRNIVSLVDYKQTSRNLYLVFEYCKHTDLEAHMQKYTQGKLPEDKVRRIAVQIKNAFKVLRANKVVHRDLKLANILVTDEFDIKLADFGFAKFLDDDEFSKSYVGTPLTMAPEIMDNRTYNEKCDLWSLGIVIYHLLFGLNPFFSKSRMTRAELKNATRAELKIPPNEISEEAEDLLRKLIARDPAKRIEFDEFFKHPWLHEENSTESLNQFLLEEALRAELGKCLLKTSRKKEEKEFMQRRGEELLAYQLIQHVRSGVEARLMFWVNLGKKIIGFNFYNTKLSYLGLAMIMDNIEQCLEHEMVVEVNRSRKIRFPAYAHLRQLQTWEMNQYTKRMPDFLERSQRKILTYIRDLHTQAFPNQAFNQKLSHLFLLELLRELENSTEKSQYLSTFLKLRPWEAHPLRLHLESPIFSENTLKLLLQKLTLEVSNDRMFRRSAGVFKLETLSEDSTLDKVYDSIKLICE